MGVGLEIGNDVGIAQNCFIQVRGKVIIGNGTNGAPQASFLKPLTYPFKGTEKPYVSRVKQE